MVSSVVYATKAELKAQIGATGTNDDTVIDALLATASRLWDMYCGRLEDGFEAADSATAREYPGTGKAWLYIDENVEITALGYKTAVTDSNYTALTTADFRGFRGAPNSRNTKFGITPYHGLMLTPNATISIFLDGLYDTRRIAEPTVQVTARWGYADTIPAVIQQATLTQATIFYKRGKAAWADVLVDGNFGEARFVRKLDPALQLLVNSTGVVRPKFGFR